MGQLAMLYPTCRLWHFQIILDGSLNFTWQMKPGNDSTDHYGLMLAPLVISLSIITLSSSFLKEYNFKVSRGDSTACSWL